MRILLQRVLRAEVRIITDTPETPARVSGRIGKGFVLLVGLTHSDTMSEVHWMADKIAGLRLFEDLTGRMNIDLSEADGSILVVSQFTLYGDVRKGKRPSFVEAASPATAIPLYEGFIAALRRHNVPVQTGEFGAMMEVELVNDGPVTIWLEREHLPEPNQ